jgi:hypothetical protein
LSRAATLGNSDRGALEKSQSIVSLKDFHFAGFLQIHGTETQVAVAPDGSPVFTRDIGTQEIYIQSVTWP